MKVNHKITLLFLAAIFSFFLFSNNVLAAAEVVRSIKPSGQGGDYTSLAAWEAGEQTDLMANDQISVAQIDGDWTSGPDITAVIINGWTTDSTHYIKIYTTSAARHQGKWDSGKYRIEVNSDAITISESYVRIEGLQISVDGSANWQDGVYSNAATDDVRISHNIIRNTSSGTSGKGIFFENTLSTKNKIWNNIIYNFSNSGAKGISIGSSDGNSFVYNNTLYNCAVGIKTEYLDIISKNNIAQNCSSGLCYTSTFVPGSNNNISSDSSIPNGINNKINTTVTFVDAANYDFHLSLSDIAAQDAGADLSSDSNLAFSDDIDGQGRSGAWDIGADEISGVPPPDTSPPNRSGGSPTGALSYDTTSTNISLSTDENAVCKYSISAGTDYSSMPNTFSTTGGTNHSTNISGLQSGQSYSYYARCQDGSGNANTNDYQIAFSVALPPDTVSPSVPADLQATAASQTQINLSWTASTDNRSVTGYKIYRAGIQINTSAVNSSSDTGLTASTVYTYTVSAYDAAGNESGQSSFASATTIANVPAFPGAEGLGANSKGGRGGTVIKVTNLNDSGAGSLRAAVQASGPRIVVFEVSGIINLDTNLIISNPYITIAGQTSPGGILVAGRTTRVNTSNVIIQHMRFRMGTAKVINGSDAETMDTFQIFGNNQYYSNPASNIIVDHCSFSWSVDETLAMGEGADNVTLSWNVISEPLNCTGLRNDGQCHSKAVLLSGKFCVAPEICGNVSFHHNYIAHSGDRNPLIGAGGAAYTGTPPFMDAVNNVIYNFGGSSGPNYTGALSMNTQYKAKVNWVHNYVKKGPNSNNPYPIGNGFEAIHIVDGGPTEPMIYVSGNIGMARTNQSAPEWNAVGAGWSGNILNQSFQQTTPWPASAITTTEMSYNYAQQILQDVGATKPVRDSVDARVVADFSAGTGAIINNVSYPASFPTFQTLAAPADTDNDGMADSWEQTQGLNVGVNDSALDQDSDGYTNIEEYLYYLSGGVTPPPSTCSSFTYSNWGSCQSDNTQTRTIISSSPSGCTGGSPATTQSCVYSSGGGGGGGGGGGSSESVITSSTSTPSSLSTSTSTSTPISTLSVVNYALKGPLGINMKSEQVKILQQMLTKDKILYPEGQITGYYGNLTIKAVQRFQCKYQNVCSGSPSTNGYGLAGPKTRIKLNEILGGSQTSANSQTTTLKGPLGINMKSEQVKILQQMLAKDKTLYPEGLITGYYGLATKKAVQKFQCKYQNVCSGSPSTNGYGLAGPKTRNKINEIFGK